MRIKRDPQRRLPTPFTPPAARSRAALGLAVAAAEGRFALQHCADCDAIAWPPRDVCGGCLSPRLDWRDTDPAGRLAAVTTIRATPDRYFREHLPWRIGTVVMDAGPSVIAHLGGTLSPGDAVRLSLKIDPSGNGVMFAMPLTPEAVPDPQLAMTNADPRDRRILITDARSPDAPALAAALRDAGAAQVFAGEAEDWRPNPQRAALEQAGAQVIPLDLSDERSVQRLAGDYGGRIEIVVCNPRHVRAGGGLARPDTVTAGIEVETLYLGPLRLAQALGPALMARGADGPSPAAVAWVNILPICALVPDPAFGGLSAAAAAGLAASRVLRAQMRGAGIRVIHVFTGPTEDEWHQPLPPPKLAQSAVARAVAEALREGIEEVFVGDSARQTAKLWTEDAALLIRERTGGAA